MGELKKELKGDQANIAFLICLYVLQSIPIGLSASVSLLLQSQNISYQSQALFSVVFWPFSLKILWAPCVDSIYSSKIGRRKSWLIPVQIAIGSFLLLLSVSVDDLLGNEVVRMKVGENHSPAFIEEKIVHDREKIMEVLYPLDNLNTGTVLKIPLKRDKPMLQNFEEKLGADFENPLRRRLLTSENVDKQRLIVIAKGINTVGNDRTFIRSNASIKSNFADRNLVLPSSKTPKNAIAHTKIISRAKNSDGDLPDQQRHTEKLEVGVRTYGQVHVVWLTLMFVCLNFLAATQDICVDGWALTMLSRRNIGWASTCNAVGPAIGWSIANPLFLALESAAFCNRYLRRSPSAHGFWTTSGFIFFWAITFMISTLLILFLRKEEKPSYDIVAEYECSVRESLSKTYKKLYSVLDSRPVRELAFIYLTAVVGFATTDSVTNLKMVEHGLPKEKLSLLTVPMIPVQILLPLYISRYTAGPRPMDLYLKAFPYRLLLNFVFICAVWWTSYLRAPGGDYPNYYYMVMIVCYGLQQIGILTMGVARTSLNARISDPAIGGTYLSLLNTFSNLGNSWPTTLSLYFVDTLTVTQCTNPSIPKGLSSFLQDSSRRLLRRVFSGVLGGSVVATFAVEEN